MRFFTHTLVLLLALGLVVVAAGCDPAQLQDPAAQTTQPAPAAQQLGPTTQVPQIAQALANGQPIDIQQQDPNGNWRYSVQSQGAGDINVAFQLGGGQPGQTTATAASIHQRVKDKLAASRARNAQRRQALQDRLAQMKARATAGAANPSALPIQASFNIHLGGNVDPAALKAQLAQLQQSAKAQQGAGGKGLTWTLGTPQAVTPTPHSGAPVQTPVARAVGSAAPGTTLLHVGSLPVTSGATPASPAAVAAPAPIASPVVDDETRDAVEETAELYLWLGSKGDIDEARDLVVERCLDGPVGQAQAVSFLDQPLELTESKVHATKLRTDSATVTYDLTGTLTQEGDEGDAIASSVNLTGELTLVNGADGWQVSCPE